MLINMHRATHTTKTKETCQSFPRVRGLSIPKQLSGNNTLASFVMYLKLSKCNNNKMGKRTTDWETDFTKTAMHVLDKKKSLLFR